MLAHQYIGQIAAMGLHEAVLGNCGTIVSFRLGAEDAPVMGRALGVPGDALTSLTRGHAYVSTLIDGQPTHAYPMDIEPASLATGKLARAITHTNAHFARPRKLAEQRKPSKPIEWS